MFAVDKGYEEVVKLLLDSKAEIRLRNKDGDTALAIALNRDNQNIIVMLESIHLTSPVIETKTTNTMSNQ